jgi:hypothetical protein
MGVCRCLWVLTSQNWVLTSPLTSYPGVTTLVTYNGIWPPLPVLVGNATFV